MGPLTSSDGTLEGSVEHLGAWNSSAVDARVSTISSRLAHSHLVAVVLSAMSTPSTNTGSRAGAPAMSTPTTNTGSRDGAPAEKRYHEAVGDSPSTNTGSRDGAPAEKRYHEAVGDSQFELSLRSIPELQRASSCAALAAVSVLDAANADERPTFAVDISSDHPHEGPLDLIYVNPALSAAKRLLAKTRGNASPGASLFTDADEPHVAFKGWLWGKSEERDKARRGSAYLFGDYLWCFTTVKHYAIVSGVPQALLQPDPEPGVPRRYTSIDPRERRQPRYLPQVALESATMMPTVQTAAPRTPLEAAKPTANTKSSTRYGPFDYTLDPPPQVMSEHVRNFRSVKWEKTSLGPMHTWGPQLRCVVNVVMNDNHPAVLFWGDDVTMIYNEAYIEILSLLHPCMGQSARVAAKDYWPLFQPIIDHVNATGETVCNFDMPLFLDRHGFLEETFFSFQVTSILNSTGHVAGYYQALIETTKNVLLERRVSSLVEIGSQTAKARDLRTYWDLVLNTLAINDRDAPFALLYGAEYLSAPSSSCVSSPGDLSTEVDHFVLKGSIGVDANHTIAPSSIDIKIDGSTIFHPYLIKAIRTSKPIVVHLSELELPDDMLDGIHWKGYGDPCRSVIVCPVLPTTSKQIQGFLIVGINPRRPFDEDYQQFVHVMLRLLATSLASVVLFDEEIRQKERAIGQAARIQEQLLEELQLKEKKFQRFAERSEIAIFILDAVGKFTYRNQSWYDMFETAVNEEDAMSAWTKIVFPEDIAKCEGVFAELAVQQVPICFELRTSMPWTPPPKLTQPANKDRTQSKEQEQEQEHYKWILCSAYPELDAKGRVIEIVGNVTDISKQKWAEGMQKMRTDDALEGKRHLEHFIDTTSHEMRNPLSAIMQCADGILTSYPATDTDTDNDFPTPSPTSYAEFLDQTMDAAQIIAQCAQHMKRIVDDILTISKLDSGLLAITPIDAQPESVTRHAVKMFESEAKAADVDMCLQVDQSFRDLHVDWVSLDPTRLLQVLINLITNALKFTRLESTRHITVTLAADNEEPKSLPCGSQFETKLLADDSHLADDWKRGSIVYLQFSVADTGRGLSDNERSSLFARFSQASPRTHINYGGSGLGLFISRRLTEMQGGSIGLSSVFKKGSTFSFYIKARRSTSARARRPSILSNSPEDIRHRVSTRKEIHQLHNLTPSPVSTTSSPTFSRTRPRSQEQAIHDSPTKKKGSGGLDTPRMPSIVRRQSALNSDVPSEAIGLPRDPDLLELTKSRSIPDTLHVLVVEDNLVNQKVLAQQLRKLGCIVSVANHGVEAIDFLPKTKYWSSNAQQHIGATEPPNFSHSPPSSNENDLPVDLSVILMDWEMPRMNGLTATTRIRDLEREGWLTGRIPVIGVTANVRQQQIRQAMEAGMDDVVSKPFRVAELMGRMRGIVQGMGGAHQADGKVGDDGRGRERSGSILGDGGGRDRSGSGYFNSRLERHEPGG